MRGFFAGSTLITTRPVESLLPKCGACGLYRSCLSPKMKPYGQGRKRILVVGEAPGETEDQDDRPFVGEAGQLLRQSLARAGVDLDEDCWTTNAIICRPPGNKIPNEKVVEYCRPNLTHTVRELNPEVIILLGHTAVKSMIGGIWKTAVGSISRWVGWQIPAQRPNAWVCPTWHPSYLLRTRDRILEADFDRHLREAVNKPGRPWEVLPDYASKIEVIFDPEKAAAILREWRELGGTFAVDYENNCLQPETEGGEIVCCSVCREGERTIAFPWHGAAIQATGELLHADNCRFIAAGIKHEDRWTRRQFGKGVRHWFWCTMTAQHVIDNRKEICGLKFQAFIYFGAEAYDEHISQFFETRGNKKLNLVKDEVDLRQLLVYCGTDTYLEFILCFHQRQILSQQLLQHGHNAA